MKKFTIILIIVCLLTVFAVTAVACVDKDDDGREILGKPSITMVGNVIRWENVKKAEKYSVNLTGNNLEEQNITVETNSVTIGPFETNVNKVYVKVKALGNGDTTADGQYSNVLEYIPGLRLETPQLSIVPDNEDYKLTWTAINKATGYKIKMECVGNTAKNKDYNVGNVTQLIISKADMTTPAKYRFTIQALGNNEQNIIESAWGGDVEYNVTKQLDAPKDVYYNNNGIFWKSVNNAKQYNIYYSEYESDNYLLLATTSSISYRKDALVENEKLSIGRRYKFKVSATNKDNSTIYFESEKTQVMDSTNADAETAYLTKLSGVTSVALNGNTLTFTGSSQATAGYVVEMQSGENNKESFDIEFNADSTSYSVDLDAKFEELNKTTSYGKVYTIKVCAKSTTDGTLLESKKSDVIDTNNNLSEYVYTGYFESMTSSDKWSTATIDKESYRIVDSLAKFVYMLNDSDSSAKYTISNFNGNGAKIYGGGVFNGVINGRGNIARDFSLIKKGADGTYSLFSEISANASVSNISFIDVKMDSNVIEKTNDSGDKVNTFNSYYTNTNSAFLTITNNGTVNGIYYNANVLATGNHGGLVYINNGTISNSTVSGTILAEGNVGGITYENTGNILNSYVSDATISSTNIIDTDVNAINNTDKTFIVGGMVAIGNSGAIKNCGILNSVISISQTGDADSDISAYVGGFIGKNVQMNIEESYIETLTNSATKTTVSVRLSFANAGSLARFAGGFIGQSTGAGNITDSYVRGIEVNATDAVAGGIIANINTDANISISNVFIDNCKISSSEKDALSIDVKLTVSVSESYFSRTDINNSVYTNMVKCTLNQLKENVITDDGKYIYNDSLGIVLKTTLIANNSILNPSRASTGRSLYATVYEGTVGNSKPTSAASVERMGNFVDRYEIGDKIFFVTVKVK